MAEANDSDGTALFEDIGDELVTGEQLEWRTLFGFACFRRKGEFVSVSEHVTGSLAVKLPKARVAELIKAGTGAEFRQNDRFFKEWVAIAERDEPLWREMLEESIAFADINAEKKSKKIKMG